MLPPIDIAPYRSVTEAVRLTVGVSPVIPPKGPAGAPSEPVEPFGFWSSSSPATKVLKRFHILPETLSIDGLGIQPPEELA